MKCKVNSIFCLDNVVDFKDFFASLRLIFSRADTNVVTSVMDEVEL